MRMLKNLLTTHDVAFATSLDTLFSHVSITVTERDRIGLIGNNGVGKTTFLRLLEGTLIPDSGTVVKNGSVAYVSQISKEFRTHETVEEFLQSKGCLYQEFSDIYRHIFSSKIPNRESYVYTMSGGECTKFFIALGVATGPDVLLLDEPTNHLDERSVDELRQWILSFRGAVVFVSHNRSFLSYVAHTVWELEKQRVSVFGGDYENYIEKKRHDADARARQYEVVKKELSSLKEGVRMREIKASRAECVHHKNKSEPSRDKSAENYFRNRSEKGIGKIKQKHDVERNAMEGRLELLRNPKIKSINVPLQSQLKVGQLLIDTKDLVVKAGSAVVVRVPHLRVEVGDRVSVAGNNGTGKTLLLKTLMREIVYPSINITKSGHNVAVAYIDQQYDLVDAKLTVFENIAQKINKIDAGAVYKQLGRFQFPEGYAYKSASELSGGETARLAFAIATTAPLDVLVLDEPTNNLDVVTMNIISGALEYFQGALVVVSHDTTFLESLKINQEYKIKNNILVST